MTTNTMTRHKHFTRHHRRNPIRSKIPIPRLTTQITILNDHSGLHTTRKAQQISSMPFLLINRPGSPTTLTNNLVIIHTPSLFDNTSTNTLHTRSHDTTMNTLRCRFTLWQLIQHAFRFLNVTIPPPLSLNSFQLSNLLNTFLPFR